MKCLHFDLIGGASGDMILGAMVDAGLPIATLKKELDSLKLAESEIEAKEVEKNGFKATKVDVLVEDQTPERHLKEIELIIQNSSLAPDIKEKSTKVFRRIAEIEAKIHNVSLNDVHLHELGGTDTIIDVAGTFIGIDQLGIEEISSSPIPLGSGFVDGAHGKIPLPAPATLALLKDVPVYGREIEAELVTPTAAALITSLSSKYGPAPAMKIEHIGYGAGSRDLPIPNLLRILIGDLQSSDQEKLEQLSVLETNLDDLPPDIYPYLMNLLFESGALDVHFMPIHMKKNRPGILVQILCDILDADRLREIIYKETTTLGIKQYQVDRYSLSRDFEEVNTPYGAVRVKIAFYDQGQIKASPEYVDCARLAKENNIPLREVYRQALNAYWARHQ